MANLSEPASKEYASALFDLAQQKGEVQRIFDELKPIDELVRGNREFRQFFLSPNVPVKIKQDALRSALATFHPLVVNFLCLLVSKRRETLLDNIMDDLAARRDAAENRMHVRIESAEPLERDMRSSLTSTLERASGRQVELHVEVKPELIGGLTIRIGDRLLDATIRRKLEGIRNLLQAEVTFSGDSYSEADAIFRAAKSNVATGT